MTVSEFLKERNTKIIERYKQLRDDKVSGSEAKQIISSEFAGLSIHTIGQIVYNKEYSNSPHKDKS
ncbi:hypothetical protein Q765_18430 [Flavobacterium rivuli WB 3.3-2 = DSM 21788]|uniref:Uncharacterized protein n=1 Tax=Flavobacterium rivuli WB 3.3-2 = DSM 21788 TaxID=1121895 RepID=A0A0A2LX86_9FLAO|nr:hypothetical protein [Flavobacterium rivuli]KGO84992.1 hypothetical protein Q765_18430 [Flavobacterium rivuli WB 3.3-2 = DSM 21788]